MRVEVRAGERGAPLETVAVDDRPFRIRRQGPPTSGAVTVDGAPHRLEVDADERAAMRRPVTVLGVRDPDTVVLHAEEDRRGRWSDWMIVVDGRTFRLRAPTFGAAAPAGDPARRPRSRLAGPRPPGTRGRPAVARRTERRRRGSRRLVRRRRRAPQHPDPPQPRRGGDVIHIAL